MSPGCSTVTIAIVPAYFNASCPTLLTASTTSTTTSQIIAEAEAALPQSAVETRLADLRATMMRSGELTRVAQRQLKVLHG